MVGDAYRILLSLDGGATFPDTVANNVPHDSLTWNWTIPAINYCTTCRVKIEIVTASDSIIGYDISNNDFTVREMNPPIPFSLLQPLDSTILADPRPTLLWEASFDSLSGIEFYAIYINDTLVHTCSDTSWTLDFDLSGGYSRWYIVAYDSATNYQQSNETWTMILDTVGPIIDSTTLWSDTSYTGPFTVYTNIVDMLELQHTRLYYKRLEDPSWFFVNLNAGTNNWYYGEIPQVVQTDDTVKYYIYAEDIAQNQSTDPLGAPANYYWFIANSTGIRENETIPMQYSFKEFGSPLHDRVQFAISLPDKAFVSLKIYDISGRHLHTPLYGHHPAGYHSLEWRPPLSGIYFYVLESPWEDRTGKIIFIK
jgi:hypothetical protein